MILLMAKPVYEEGLTIRTNPGAKTALGRAVAGLKGVRDLRFFGNKVSQEAVVNASWLWMESMDAHDLAAVLAPHLTRLESLMNESGPPTKQPLAPPSAEEQGVDAIPIRPDRPSGQISPARDPRSGGILQPKGKGRTKSS